MEETAVIWHFIIFLLCVFLPNGPTASGCSRPLGLMSGTIQDWQISASSALAASRGTGCHMRHARLFQASGQAWCAAHRSALEWLQVDLGVAAKITGIMTQGRGDGREWVTAFLVSYSSDAFHWKYCNDIYGNRKVFKGNMDSHTVKYSHLDHPVQARFIRIYILEWHGHPSMRLEIIGCQECNEIISLPPRTKMSSSSSRPWEKQRTCSADDGFIFSHGAWCARWNNANQWLQFDLGPPTLVTGLMTKGRGDHRRKQWVTSFTLSYSNDSTIWHFYKDDNHLDPKVKVFGGNMDRLTERRHYLNQPFVARYVRIHPTGWKSRISMRAGILGCSHKGDCGPGFLRIHEDSDCVENLAFKKLTWVNDKRHSWHGWKYGHSSFAVDGDSDTHLQRCAILDNYYVETPLWMVDLGHKKIIQGVVVLTWQGKGQDRANLYRDYIYNLDKLTVLVADKAQLENVATGRKCASVSRTNNALFHNHLHFECPANLQGRFVYIKASGMPNRWSRLFSAVLCEVMVY